MGFFDKAKKFLKEGVNELASDVTEKPQFYKYVEQLVSEITAVQHNKK